MHYRRQITLERRGGYRETAQTLGELLLGGDLAKREEVTRQTGYSTLSKRDYRQSAEGEVKNTRTTKEGGKRTGGETTTYINTYDPCG